MSGLNPNHVTEGYWGDQALRIMREYDLVTAISIRALIKPCTWKMGSSIFAAMSRLKFMSITRDFLSSIPSSERKKRRKMFLLIVAVITVLMLLDFLPLIQERCHWIKSVGVRVSVAKFDVYDGVILSVPWALNCYVTLCLQFSTPLTYLSLWCATNLVDEGFGAYIWWGEEYPRKLYEFVTQFVLTCKYKASPYESKYVTYI